MQNNQRQYRTLHIQKDVIPYTLCSILCPVPAALASIFRVDSISTSYNFVSIRRGDLKTAASIILNTTFVED